MIDKFYPKLTALINISDLPSEISFAENIVNNLFDNIYYRNLQISTGLDGSYVNCQIELIVFKPLRLELPFCGIALLLNADYTSGGMSVIPVTVSKISNLRRFIGEFKIENFSFSVEDIIDNVLLKLFSIKEKELIVLTGISFYSEQDYLNGLANHLNSNYGTNISFPLNSDIDIAAADIEIELANASLNIKSILLSDFILVGDFEQNIRNFNNVFSSKFGGNLFNKIKESLLPVLSAKLNITPAIEISRNYLIPIKADGTIETNENIKTTLLFAQSEISFNTKGQFGFSMDTSISFPASHPKAQILNTGFAIGFDTIKLDLSRNTNIAEADADGRPSDFVGVYIKDGIIDFPAEWNHNPPGSPPSTGELYVRNLLVGTGGISGTIGLRAITAGTLSPLLQIKFGSGFVAELDAFDLTFHQNQIIGSNIKGAMLIPGFKDNTGADAKIFIDIHIGQDGEFNVVASVTNAVTVIKIPDVFAFDVKSIFIGKKDGRFYVGCSGDIDFLLQDPIGKFLPDKVDIKKLIIYDDGKFEIEGGSIYLPKAFELKLGPAKIGITAIHLGSYEKDDRKYKYFGFDGGVKVDPGGVDARGKGIKYYYTTDGPFNSTDHKFKWFIRLESLSIDIIIPGSSDPKDAAVIIKGFLSIKDPKIPPGTVDPLLTILKNATEYAGGVYISIPKFKGLEASASMRMTPQVPAFIVDLGVEISTPILLGTTGLGIYGFRAIFGKRYVATKFAADIPEDGEWWQYYKAKIDPDYKEGIQLSKFSIKEGFSVGAGVSLATSSDSGKTFSSKLFFLLSLPDVFLFQGQAQFLKDRISLDAVPDPPFFAIIAITKHSIEAGFGINYKIPDDTGKLVTVDGVTELGFFFGDAAAWYFNIGRESPDSMRIQARVFDILNMYFYFMISNSGIRAGAGVSFELKKSFGPLSAELKAFMDSKGRISFRPKEIGGAIQIGGTVSLKCCGFGFSVSGGATLAAEAPKPHIITGEFEVCVKVLKKERCAHFEFTWNFDSSLNSSRNPVLVDVAEGSASSNANDLNKVAKSNHMVTGETLNLATVILNDSQSTSSIAIPHPDTWINNNPTLDNYRVPVDTFIDIEFKKGLNVSPSSSATNNLNKIGGISSPCEYVEFVPPQRGYSDRVRHEYFFEDIEIKYWDENIGGGSWQDYNFYDALIPMFPGTTQVGTLITPSALANLKWGYWQQQRPGYNNKLRILATTPLSYAAKTGSLPVENLGINGDTILCPGDEIPKTCVIFDRDQVYQTYPGETLNTYKGILFKLTTHDGIVLSAPYLGVANGMLIQPGDTLDLFFNEPMKYVNLVINSGAPNIVVDYYERVTLLDAAGHEILSGGLPQFQYNLIESKSYTSADWSHEISYTHATKNIDSIKITSVSCYQKPDEPRKITCLKTDEQTVVRIRELTNFIATLIKNKHFAVSAVQLNPQNAGTYTGVYMGTGLYPNKNFKENIINLIQGYISGTTLLFTISDNLGFSCNYSFELIKPVTGFNFANITSVVSLTPYTTGATVGANYNFILTVNVMINGAVKTVELLGKSCLPMAYCYDVCSSALYRVCYLSYANYLLNQTIPSLADQTANNQAMIDGINKTLQPIWRPNTTFAIRVKTSDRLYREGGSSQLTAPYNLDMAYGFKTAGPVGHYHNYPVNNTPATQQVRKDFQKLDTADKPDDFKLLSLKYYIDYTKCYPNADGDIINAKPLFYLNAELRLFYLYNYVYEFYNDWVDTTAASGSTHPYIAKSSLNVLVRDPEDSGIPEVNPTLGFVGGSINHVDPNTVVGGPPLLPININSINNDISTLNNILLNGNTCQGYTPLAPIDISTKKTLDLKPLKIYTAQFIAKYNPLIGGQYAAADYESLAHTYVFQTSRYKDFEEQVNSYILKKDTLGAIVKEAVFVLNAEKAGTIPQLDLSLATSVITNNEAAIPDAIKLQYADQFDRLINGVLHLDYNTLHASASTEFNIIKHPDTGKIIGILIRNPEPFNDPKIPRANPNLSSTELTETLEVRKLYSGIDPSILADPLALSRVSALNYWGNPSEFYVIHSKDRSKMFVTNRNFNFNIDALSKLKFTFRYKLYNGVDYSNVSNIDVEINLSSYSI